MSTRPQGGMPVGDGYTCTPTQGNAVELMAGGQEFYPRMLQDITAAQDEVLMGSYLWEPDETGRRFLTEARRAARRGVRVRVLLDGIGGRRLDIEDLESLQAAGGRFAWYHALRFPLIDSRLMRRFHRKLLVVDGRVAYTGGAGYADGWAYQPPSQWWDIMARLTGPVAQELRRLFADDWLRVSKEQLPNEPPASPVEPAGPETLHTLITRRGSPELLRRLRREIAEARQQVLLVSAYFVPGFRFRRSLLKAAGRGVDVRILLPGPRTDHIAVRAAGRRYYHKLLESGVRIYEFQRSMLHSKYAVIDDRCGFLGSSNLDNWSARFNLELDLAVHTGATLDSLRAQFEDDLGASREINLQQWRARPWTLRLAETLFGWIDPLL